VAFGRLPQDIHVHDQAADFLFQFLDLLFPKGAAMRFQSRPE